MFQTRVRLASAFAVLVCTLPRGGEAFNANPLNKIPMNAASRCTFLIMLATESKNEEGVVELLDEEESTVVPDVEQTEQAQQIAPFLSQGEIADDVLNPDLSDPKQTRVIIYTIISLLPVLFLIPLMLASRDLIPLGDVPPVQM